MSSNPPPEEPTVQPAFTVAVKDPDGRVIQLTPKAFENVFRGVGYELVDPADYPGWDSGYKPQPARNDVVKSITRGDAQSLDPEQVAKSGRKK